jgi:ankyrin repeat protein
LEAAQVLLDAGADVNGFSTSGSAWPLAVVARTASDAGMAWLLERGASLTQADSSGSTIAHQLAGAESAPAASADANVEDRLCRWLRRVIAAEPILLQACDEGGSAPLSLAAGTGAEARVTTLLALGADVACCDVNGETPLSLACAADSLPVVGSLQPVPLASVSRGAPEHHPICISRAACATRASCVRGVYTCCARMSLAGGFQDCDGASFRAGSNAERTLV